jgi:hypothetical protein
VRLTELKEYDVMKRLLLLLLCGLCVVLLISCQGAGRSKSGFGTPIKDDREFPEFLAGTWKAKDSPWKIVLAADGTVSSAVIPMGEVEVRPNQTTKVEGWRGEPGIFEAGDFVAQYGPKNRELVVTIEMKRIYAEMGGILDGTCKYYLIGGLSEDGEIWNADVFNLLDAVVLAPEPNSAEGKPAFKKTGVLRSELDDGSERLIFTKVESNGGKK